MKMRSEIYKKYKIHKSKNTKKIKKEDDMIIMEMEKFDPDTGDKLPVLRRLIKLDELLAQRDKIQLVLDDIDELIADVQTL
jgi:hypothetical protein